MHVGECRSGWRRVVFRGTQGTRRKKPPSPLQYGSTALLTSRTRDTEADRSVGGEPVDLTSNGRLRKVTRLNGFTSQPTNPENRRDVPIRRAHRRHHRAGALHQRRLRLDRAAAAAAYHGRSGHLHCDGRDPGRGVLHRDGASAAVLRLSGGPFRTPDPRGGRHAGQRRIRVGHRVCSVVLGFAGAAAGGGTRRCGVPPARGFVRRPADCGQRRGRALFDLLVWRCGRVLGGATRGCGAGWVGRDGEALGRDAAGDRARTVLLLRPSQWAG